MRQIEQLHSLTVTRAGASTSKAIAPQWQPPRCVTSAAASGTGASRPGRGKQARAIVTQLADRFVDVRMRQMRALLDEALDRKSTRLNSSHSQISYAVFCLKKKTN